jgi:serine/threonine-protein kinase
MTLTLLNNRYRVLQTLGGGGFSNTFLAEDTYLPSSKRCVIKQLKPVTNDAQTYKLVQERFQREAAVLEDLGEGSNQIPKLFAYFSEAGQFYLVQEYIEGDTLTKKVEKRGALSENEVKQILVSLLPVLDYVHSRHMVHRDIKPDNAIIRNRDGLPVLIDFGAVKEAMNTVVNDPRNSAPSMVIGTPGFMPSEQAGGRPTYASDLYSLGLTAVFLLTGKMPQELETDARTGEFTWHHHAPNISSNLARVIDQAIRFNARDRFANATAMLNALQSSNAAASSSNRADSEMATLAVAPGGLPHQGNRPIPPVGNSSPQHTVPVGTNPVIAKPGSDRKPLIIGALIAGGLLLGAIAIALGLRRSPDPSSQVASDSAPTSEQATTQQPSFSPSPTRSQPSNSAPVSESTTRQPSASTSTRSRSQPSDNTPPPVVAESPVTRSTQAPSQISTRSTPPPSSPVPSTAARNNNQNPDASRSIPGFPPGTQRNYVREELGNPTKVSNGYWNTRAVLYRDFVPDRVDLGYLFDQSSGRLRQTEATFAPSVAPEMMSGTLGKMLNGNPSPDIQQGLQDVYQGKSKRYKFESGRGGSLKGVIERNDRDRIYIAVWESDLHD